MSAPVGAYAIAARMVMEAGGSGGRAQRASMKVVVLDFLIALNIVLWGVVPALRHFGVVP